MLLRERLAVKKPARKRREAAPAKPVCARCTELDAMEAQAHKAEDVAGRYVNESKLLDVKILRARHEPECLVPRGGERG
ncbi:hypothetical protein [Kitasatospora purpeofusca]|uniref:hypothetical protein n=1 Tax=Kitasatospora purpeofusca TaxID=67352 RepID=UPI0036BC39A1